ncbi:cystathionine beta-synthase isoform X1 [Neodiprion virginianus]|uniref:cystathionine beta-synthase isoform X1 n=1 Tax=Neodiprion virginianus TaxID=2961670 RepID=UPI001EE70028|nr:cystathionine beta-synthase isoform X1 [Neodiprion virginianus]
MELIRPDLPSRCTWQPNAKNNPHTTRPPLNNRKEVLPNILAAIGQTPMVRLNNICKSFNIKCELLAKCEFLNPGGSVKDRIAHRMIQDAEDKGILKPGYTIIEPTSGNTGIGLAMASAVKGYRCIIVMPEKMSNEKVDTLRALGAEIVRTPTEAAWDSPEGHITVSQKLQKEIPNSVILDQYTNCGNPLAHYDQTAYEIWEQCKGKIDYLVAGAGTGGTISGISRRFKELIPQTKIVAIDPEGSILAEPAEINQSEVTFYEVEGIGYDFTPTVLDRGLVDLWVKTNDKDSLNCARALIREEGLLCGGSSGASMSAALKLAKDLPEDQRVVVILPDGLRNYMTKFVSDHWMEARGFLDPPPPVEANKWWWTTSISNLRLNPLSTLPAEATCQEAIAILKKGGFDQIPLIEKNGSIQGVVTLNDLTRSLISGKVKSTDCARKVLFKQFRKLTTCASLGRLSRILEKDAYVVIVNAKQTTSAVGIATQMDLLNYISEPHSNGTAA